MALHKLTRLDQPSIRDNVLRDSLVAQTSVPLPGGGEVALETAALEALYANKFDVEGALAAMDKSYSETGHYRDKFAAWSAAEAEMICDSASRHNDDLQQLGSVLETKEPKQVIEFYNHMLRHHSDYQAVTRLFQTAEYSRRSGGSECAAAPVPDQC